jgi:hypothetical protein
VLFPSPAALPAFMAMPPSRRACARLPPRYPVRMTRARPSAVSDAMPTTRGLNFFLADPHLGRLCLTLMGREVYERARPHLVDLGAVAGDELDALAAQADKHPPVLRPYDERGARVDTVDRS